MAFFIVVVRVTWSCEHGPQWDSGNAGAKKALDVFENKTKADFQKTFLAKYDFKKSGGREACPPQPFLLGFS